MTVNCCNKRKPIFLVMGLEVNKLVCVYSSATLALFRVLANYDISAGYSTC